MVSARARLPPRRFMKIMRFDSWRGGCADRRSGTSIRIGIVASPRSPAGDCAISRGVLRMQWQTPTAVDFRFGFEITLYVAAR
jgi:coenzyme PQQ precursor peptide PqqA